MMPLTFNGMDVPASAIRDADLLETHPGQMIMRDPAPEEIQYLQSKLTKPTKVYVEISRPHQGLNFIHRQLINQDEMQDIGITQTYDAEAEQVLKLAAAVDRFGVKAMKATILNKANPLGINNPHQFLTKNLPIAQHLIKWAKEGEQTGRMRTFGVFGMAGL